MLTTSSSISVHLLPPPLCRFKTPTTAVFCLVPPLPACSLQFPPVSCARLRPAHFAVGSESLAVKLGKRKLSSPQASPKGPHKRKPVVSTAVCRRPFSTLPAQQLA